MMKKLSCKAMGEDCDFVAVGSTEDEVIKKMNDHAKFDHPDKWAKIERLSEEEKKNMEMGMRERMKDTEEEF